MRPPSGHLSVAPIALTMIAVVAAGCGRSFGVPSVQPTVSSMSLVGGGPLESSQVVLSGESIAIQGTQLAGAQVQVGGQPATVAPSSGGPLTFIVPAPVASSLGS